MASWKKILTALPAMTDLGTGTPGSLFLKGDGTWATPTDTNTNTNQLTTFDVRDDDDDDVNISHGEFLQFISATGTAGTQLSGSGGDGDPFVMTITSPNTGDVNQNAFTTVVYGSSPGDDVQADAVSDTLNFTSSGAMTITGTSSSDTINFSSANTQLSNAGVIGKVLTGISTGSGGTVVAADTILAAFGRIEYRVALNDAKATDVNHNTDTNVSASVLKTRLGEGFASNAVSIGDSGDTITIPGDLTLSGDLTVNGSTITANVGEIIVRDKNIELASGATQASHADGGGITLTTSASLETAIKWVSGGTLAQWSLYQSDSAVVLPIQVCQTEVTSGAPSGLNNLVGSMCYNSADETMYLYL